MQEVLKGFPMNSLSNKIKDKFNILFYIIFCRKIDIVLEIKHELFQSLPVVQKCLKIMNTQFNCNDHNKKKTTFLSFYKS